MNKSNHRRYFSQPQLLSTNGEFRQISPKMAQFESSYQPPSPPTLTQFQQKYFSQLFDRYKQMSRQKNKSQHQRSQIQEENHKISSPNMDRIKEQKQSYRHHSKASLLQENLKSTFRNKPFTEFMEDKYQKLSLKQLREIPPSFLQTFNLKKGDQLIYDTVIESNQTQSISNFPNNTINNSIEFSNDSTIIKATNETSPLNVTNSLKTTLLKKFTLSPNSLDKMASQQKKSTVQHSFGYSNSPNQRFEIRRSILLIQDRRKKIVLNELTKEVLQRQWMQREPQKNLQNNTQSTLISPKSDHSQKYPQIDKKFKHKVNLSQHINSLQQSIYQDIDLQQSNFYHTNSQPFNPFQREDEIIQDGEASNLNQITLLVSKSQDYIDNSQDLQNSQKKFTILCKYCSFQDSDTQNKNQFQKCKCKGINKLYPIQHSVSQISQKQISHNEFKAFEDKYSIQDEYLKIEKVVSKKSQLQTLQLPSLVLSNKNQSSSLQDNPYKDKGASYSHMDQKFSLKRNSSILPLRKSEKSQEIKDKQNQIGDNQLVNEKNEDLQLKNSISQQIDRSFQKNIPIINRPYTPLKIQNALKKKELIKHIQDGSSVSQRNIKLPDSPSNRKGVVNHRLGLNLDEQQKAQGEQLINLTDQSMDKKKQNFAMHQGSAKDYKLSDSSKSNTLKKILDLQREKDEYESKRLLQDNTEMDLLFKKSKHLNEGNSTPKTNRGEQSRRKRDSIIGLNKSRDFTLDPCVSPKIESPNNSIGTFQDRVQTMTVCSPITNYYRKTLNSPISKQNQSRAPSLFFSQTPTHSAQKSEIYHQQMSTPQNKRDKSKKGSDVHLSFAHITKTNEQQQNNLKNGDEGQLIKYPHQVSYKNLQKNNEEEVKQSKANQKSNKINKQESQYSIKPNEMLFIPSRIKETDIFKRSTSFALQIENNHTVEDLSQQIPNLQTQYQIDSKVSNFSNFQQKSIHSSQKFTQDKQKHQNHEPQRNYPENSRASNNNQEQKNQISQNTMFSHQNIPSGQFKKDIPQLSLHNRQNSMFASTNSNNCEVISNESLKSPVYLELIKKRQERNDQQNEIEQMSKLKLQEAFELQQQEKQKEEIRTKLTQKRIRHQGSISLYQQKSLTLQSPSKTDLQKNQQNEQKEQKFQFIEDNFQHEKEKSVFAANRTPAGSSIENSSNQLDSSEEEEQKENNNSIEQEYFQKMDTNESQNNPNQNIESQKIFIDFKISQDSIQQIQNGKNSLENLQIQQIKQDKQQQICIDKEKLADSNVNTQVAPQNHLLDICRTRQESESRQIPPPPPNYRLSINLEQIQSPYSNKSPLCGSNRRVSIFQEKKFKQQEQSEQKSLKNLFLDSEKLIQQFIDKLYHTYQETEEDEKGEDKNFKFFKNINKKYNYEENKKTDLIKDLAKQIRQTFRDDFIQIPFMKNIMKNYLEYCFSEIPLIKDDIFVQFKIKKRTLESIIGVFMFIFEENEYPIDIIAQAESSMKKNYKLITYLPCLQDEIGGSNFLNKITVNFSAALRSRLIDMYKNIELDDNDQKVKDLQNNSINKSHFTKNYIAPPPPPSAFKILIDSEKLTPLEDNILSSQISKEKKYSVIESNVESHFEQVFLRNHQKRGSAQFIESQKQIKRESFGTIEQIQSSKFVGKYQLEQIEQLHQQVMNLMRFIYHNNSYSQLDMSNMLDKSNIKSICKIFDVNQNCFFEIKELLWTTLKEYNIYPTTLLRIQEQLERYRYILSIVPLVEHLFSDPTINDSIIREMEWRLTSEDNIVKALFENQSTLKAFCETLIQEFIYRVKSTYNIEIFFKVLNMNESQYDFIAEQFQKSISQVGFDYSFCEDINIKFLKLKYKLNILPPPLRLIGGYTAIKKIIEVAHNMISNPQYENEYTEYIKKFPEDLHNLLYELPPNYIVQNSKYNKKPGLRFFEFFILSLLSCEDCYSISDLRAGLQTFNITKTTPIHWKSLFEQSMKYLNYPEDVIKIILQQISNQFLIFYQEQTDANFTKPLLK